MVELTSLFLSIIDTINYTNVHSTSQDIRSPRLKKQSPVAESHIPPPQPGRWWLKLPAWEFGDMRQTARLQQDIFLKQKRWEICTKNSRKQSWISLHQTIWLQTTEGRWDSGFTNRNLQQRSFLRIFFLRFSPGGIGNSKHQCLIWTSRNDHIP